jgi:hypothetical protein
MRANVLGNYVLSDMELEVAAETEEDTLLKKRTPAPVQTTWLT